jgi:hypothetical protein
VDEEYLESLRKSEEFVLYPEIIATPSTAAQELFMERSHNALEFVAEAIEYEFDRTDVNRRREGADWDAVRGKICKKLAKVATIPDCTFPLFPDGTRSIKVLTPYSANRGQGRLRS